VSKESGHKSLVCPANMLVTHRRT